MKQDADALTDAEEARPQVETYEQRLSRLLTERDTLNWTYPKTPAIQARLKKIRTRISDLKAVIKGEPLDKRRLAGGNKEVWSPTEDEIQAACQQFQGDWSKTERRSRMVVKPTEAVEVEMVNIAAYNRRVP